MGLVNLVFASFFFVSWTRKFGLIFSDTKSDDLLSRVDTSQSRRAATEILHL